MCNKLVFDMTENCVQRKHNINSILVHVSVDEKKYNITDVAISITCMVFSKQLSDIIDDKREMSTTNCSYMASKLISQVNYN